MSVMGNNAKNGKLLKVSDTENRGERGKFNIWISIGGNSNVHHSSGVASISPIVIKIISFDYYECNLFHPFYLSVKIRSVLRA